MSQKARGRAGSAALNPVDLSGIFKALALRFERTRWCRIPAPAQKTFCMKARALTVEIVPDERRDIVI